MVSVLEQSGADVVFHVASYGMSGREMVCIVGLARPLFPQYWFYRALASCC